MYHLHKVPQQGPGGYHFIVIPHNGDKDVTIFWSVQDVVLHDGGICCAVCRPKTPPCIIHTTVIPCMPEWHSVTCTGFNM